MEVNTVLDGNDKACSGCAACKNICPKNAITMNEDKEGFLYPEINDEICINCNLCRKTCPVLLKNAEKQTIKNVYAAKLKDSNLLLKSRSGGAFVAFSNWILKNRGIVYGAAFDNNFLVHHIRCTNIKERDMCTGSKYVQSDIEMTYKSVAEDLSKNKKVLYTGTACQIKGLKNFIMNKKIDDDNLYTCDIICHGVPSPKVYREYISFLENKYKRKILEFNFRNKKYGWGGYEETVLFEGNKEKNLNYFRNIFWKDQVLRPSCYECSYASLNRIADVTIGDCWGINNIDHDWDVQKGVSLIVINSSKGQQLFNSANIYIWIIF